MKKWENPQLKSLNYINTFAIIPTDAESKDRPNAGPNSQGRCRNPSKYPNCPHRKTHSQVTGTDADCDLILTGDEPAGDS